MNVLDLFSGIGGFSLGLERAGMRTVAFCEIEPYCRAVLAKHWPGVSCYTDIRELTADRLAADGIRPDVICGGFPCQDISVAGKGAGLAGARSGLWSHYARLIGELRPKYVIVENVAALLSRGLGEVLGELATLGYDTEWHCIPASYVGAPHRRDRIWIVAYPSGDQLRLESGRSGWEDGAGETEPRDNGSQGALADTAWIQSGRTQQRSLGERVGTGSESVNLADAAGERRERSGTAWNGRDGFKDGCEDVADAAVGGSRCRWEGQDAESLCGGRWWEFEPDVGRVAHGVPARVDRLRSLGNAVVPQIPEIIGRAIMTAHNS